MKEEGLFRIIGDVDDDLVEEAAVHAKSRPVLTPAALRWGGLAACLVLVLGFGVARFSSTPQLLPRTEAPQAARAEITPFSSPMGMRKFFNYAGFRYAFLEDGAPYDLSGMELGDSLGTLEHDILAGMDGFGENEAAVLDLAATFALGGEVYRLPGYDPAFRLAVIWEGEAYLAQLVGRVDDQPLEAAYFFAVSEMEARIRRVEILPHMGGAIQSTVKGAEAKKLVRILAGSTPAELTGEDYLSMAAAQTEGRSWQLALCLDDGTALAIYLIPDLGLASIGDSTYVLPEEFREGWGHHLDGLVQGSAPLS